MNFSKTLRLLVLIGLLYRPASAADEPAFEGKTLSEWTAKLAEGEYSEELGWTHRPGEAYRALRSMGSAAIPTLGDLLSHPNVIVRYNAVELLEDMGPDAVGALSGLLKALDDKSAYLRATAASILGDIGPEGAVAIPRLARMLTSEETYRLAPEPAYSESQKAREALIAIGSLAIPVFVEELKSQQASRRGMAIGSLRRFPDGANDVVPVLLRALEDREPAVRAVAAEAFQNVGTWRKAVAGALAKHLDDTGKFNFGKGYSGIVAYYSANALRDIGPTLDELPALVRLMRNQKMVDAEQIRSLEDSRLHVRWLGISLVGTLGQEARSAIPDLVALLDDKHLRSAASISLVQIDRGNERARAVLLASISKDDSRNCFESIRVARLMNWRDAETVAALKRVLDHEDNNVRIAAASGLLRIDANSAEGLKVLQKGLSNDDFGLWYDSNFGSRGWPEFLAIFREVPPAARVAATVAINKLEVIQYHRKALEALVATDLAEEAVPTFLRQSLSEDIEVRRAAVIALGGLGKYGRKGVPLLLETLKSPRVVLRGAAAESVGKIGLADAAVVTALTHALDDKFGLVRLHAVKSLGRLGPAAKSAVPALRERLRDQLDPVRQASMHAIVHIAPVKPD